MADDDDLVVVRRNLNRESEEGNQSDIANDDFDDKDTDSKAAKLTLMEEILLLGLKDREGYISFWNDSVSIGLRGCILVELGLRDRIGLEPAGMRRRTLLSRSIIVKKNIPTGDALLDEAFKHIRENKPENAKMWMEYLSGETWNPFKLTLQLRNVRERLAKNLVEKRICTTEKQNFILFDMMTHPLVDVEAKQRVVGRVQDFILNKWNTDVHKNDRRLLSLVLLAHHSDVLESALAHLEDSAYDLARKRIDNALQLDFTSEASKEGACEVLWAVLAALGS